MKTSYNQSSYIAGFVLSLLLTLVAYTAVTQQWVVGWTAIWAILALAVLQLVVQVIFFLHLGREPKPRWNLVVLLFAAMVVLILVAGSMWIMYNLNYHHGHKMTPADTERGIIQDEGYSQ